MCFSENISLISFIIGIVSSVLCISLGKPIDKLFGLFFAYVILMQLIEYLLWKHQKCDDYNKQLTQLAMILNHLQPLIFYLLIIYFFPERNTKILFFIIFLYISVIIPYSLQLKDVCTLKSQTSGHLSWEWNYMNNSCIIYSIFLLTLCLLSLVAFPGMIGINFTLLFSISFIISMKIYWTTGAIGAMWCFFAVFAPLLYFLKNK